jgi:predicted amidophosphoribosyltransferase
VVDPAPELSQPVGRFWAVICLSCTRPSTLALCDRCSSRLRSAPDRLVSDGLRVIAGCAHEGPARSLVHAVKYRSVSAAALPLVDRLVGRIPATATGLIPVPRARLRAVRYGVDPAALFAAAIANRTGLPVVRALRAPLWWPRHAPSERSARAPIPFQQLSPAPPGAVLVDDVVTTGVTVASASRALNRRPSVVLAATAAPRVGGGSTPVEAV